MTQKIYPKKPIQVSIIGASGYTGAELLRVLSNHSMVQIKTITSRKKSGKHISEVYPNFRKKIDLVFSLPERVNFDGSDVVFIATPHGVAMKYARKFLERGIKIIDLSSDFRFKNRETFEYWYKIKHECPELLKYSEYGLVELNRPVLEKANIIGNPGCYPTTILLGLAPLFKSNGQQLIDTNLIIADCKSGISGAGKKLQSSFLFCEISDNMKAYGLPEHRHYPEIVAQLQKEKIGNQKLNFTFVPHLVPMIRGMFSTIYTRVLPEARNTDFQNLFEEFYKQEYFVDVMPSNNFPETRSVKLSNRLRIAIHKNAVSNSLIILVVQDNLMKGAVGQAVQNMNLMFGLKESTGLEHFSAIP